MRKLGAWAIQAPQGLYLEVNSTQNPRGVAEYVVRAVKAFEDALATKTALSAIHQPIQLYRSATHCGHDDEAEEWGETHFEDLHGDWLCREQPPARICEHCHDADGLNTLWPCATAVAAGISDFEFGSAVWHRLAELTAYFGEVGAAMLRAAAAGRKHIMFDELPEALLQEIERGRR
jgi:hypothetical protein